MRKEDKITVNGSQITVKELTVAEVRHWMMDILEREKLKSNDDIASNYLDQGFLERIGISDIVRMTDFKREQIEQFAPSELQSIIDKCEELNPDFFGMRKRLLSAASKQILSD